MNSLVFAAANSGILTFLPLILMFGLLYFFIMRPQKKQMNLRNEMLKNLCIGDKIISVGGITGIINGLTDEYIYVEIAEGLIIEMTRQGVSQLINQDAE